MQQFIPQGLGWQRDLPDPRDFTPSHPTVLKLLEGLKPCHKRRCLPASIDLHANGDGEPAYLPFVEDQLTLNSSCAFACLALVEYFERRAGHTFEGSQLYLHQMTHGLRGNTGNAGAELRTTFKALRRFGTPPSELWPYDPSRLHTVPNDPRLTGYARDFQDITYFRLDLPNTTGQQTLKTVRSFLAAGFPLAFGFPVPRSLTADPNIPFRPTFDSYRGGQASVAIGYDDDHPGATRGALLIRSSWGTTWGTAGCGWLPYAFVERQLAGDFWTVLREEWPEPSEFSRLEFADR